MSDEVEYPERHPTYASASRCRSPSRRTSQPFRYGTTASEVIDEGTGIGATDPVRAVGRIL